MATERDKLFEELEPIFAEAYWAFNFGDETLRKGLDGDLALRVFYLTELKIRDFTGYFGNSADLARYCARLENIAWICVLPDS